jgi:plastocyanin
MDMKTRHSTYALLIGVLVASMGIPASLTAYAQQGPVYATYVVHIPANAYIKDNVHWVPQHISVPVGTTVEFANDDPDQQHTVTSDTPTTPEGDTLFDSGLMQYQAAFQYTFDKAGEYSYYCKLHPWMAGSVSVNGAYVEGHNFKLSMGNGATWDYAKIDRSLLVFEPTSISYRADEPVTYTITIFKNDQQVFSDDFRTLGGHLSIELVPTDNATRVYGPDTNEPVTGAYHIEGMFLKDNAAYKIKAEITKVVDKTPDQEIADEFGVQIVPEFPIGTAILPILIGMGAFVVLSRKYQLSGTRW